MATITVSDETFEAEVLNSSEPVLVDFWADWCQPCHALAPAIDELAEAFPGRVAKVDVDANPGLASRFDVRSIPTVLVLKQGREVERFVGITPKDRLAGALERVA